MSKHYTISGGPDPSTIKVLDENGSELSGVVRIELTAESNAPAKAKITLQQPIESGRLGFQSEIAAGAPPSTRRAIEIVLSRVKCNPHVKDALSCALYNEIRNPAEPPADLDSCRADIEQALLDLRVDQTFDKKAMLHRIEQARTRLRGVLDRRT